MRKLTKADADMLIEKLIHLDVQKMQFWYESFTKQILWKGDCDAIVISKEGFDWEIETWTRTGDFFEYPIIPLCNFTRDSVMRFSRFPIAARLRLMRVVLTLERNLTIYNERVKDVDSDAAALKTVESIVGMSDG